MSLRNDLYAHLINNTPVYAFVSLRIYPDDVPKNTAYPAISGLIVSNVPEQPLGGGSYAGWLARIQWDVLANNSDTRDTVRDALIAALATFNGAPTTPTVTVKDRVLVGTIDWYDPNTFISRATVDWQVLYV